MRLIHAETLQLVDFISTPPPYAILSHTWGDEEVSFNDIQQNAATNKLGWQKLRRTCQQALTDGKQYVWIDTCCIDKSSSAELSESINSMFRWYRQAVICYAYLEDIEDLDDLHEARWFTRAWTLQELLAPPRVIFFKKHWRKFGTKFGLATKIASITGIDESVLHDAQSLGYMYDASIAKRMSWAANRMATREEDMAYSLLGLFDVSIPLLYGEGGSKAFVRLQEEIIKKSLDQSFLTWLDPEQSTVQNGHGAGFLASHPRFFRQCVNVRATGENVPSFAINNSGLQMRVPLHRVPFEKNRYIAVLSCYLESETTQRIGILLDVPGDNLSHCQRIETEKIHTVTENQFRSARVRDCCVLRILPSQRRIRLLSILTLGSGITRGDTLCSTASEYWHYHPIQRKPIDLGSVEEAAGRAPSQRFAVAITTSNRPLKNGPKILVRIDIDNDGVNLLSAYSARLSMFPLTHEYHQEDVNMRILPLESPVSTAGTLHNFASLESKEFGNVHAFISWETMANQDVLILTIGEGSKNLDSTLLCRIKTSISRIQDGPVVLLSQLGLTALIANAFSYRRRITSVETAAPVACIYFLVWLSLSPVRLTSYTCTRWTFIRYMLGVFAVIIAFQDDWIPQYIFHSTNPAWYQITIGLLALVNCYFCTTIIRHILTICESGSKS